MGKKKAGAKGKGGKKGAKSPVKAGGVGKKKPQAVKTNIKKVIIYFYYFLIWFCL